MAQRALMAENQGLDEPEIVCELAVELGLATSVLIDSGDYALVSPAIAKMQVPATQPRTATFVFGYYHLPHLSPGEAERLIAQSADPWRSADLELGLLFNAARPNEIQKHPIVACGTRHMVLQMDHMPLWKEDPYSERRLLDLIWTRQRHALTTKHLCVDQFRYLVVRELAS